MGEYDYSKSSLWNIEHGNGIALIPEIIKPPSKKIEEEMRYFICRKCGAVYFVSERFCNYYTNGNQFDSEYVCKCLLCNSAIPKTEDTFKKFI